LKQIKIVSNEITNVAETSTYQQINVVIYELFLPIAVLHSTQK